MADRRERRQQYISEHGGESVTFDLVDSSTVNRLRREGDVVLPRRRVSVPADEAWNTRQMASRLLQGIENGSSARDISRSLVDVIGNNRASTMRNARTMFTGAENAGRIDSYRNLESQGVVQKKVWISTPDDRTREEHLAMDGEEVNPEEEFSNGCQYPGDPAGRPETVWNCRCSMRDHIIGFRRADGSISYVQGERGRTMHDEQMEEEVERRRGEEGQPSSTRNPNRNVIPQRPVRPRLANFTDENGFVDYDALYAARDNYKTELEAWEAQREAQVEVYLGLEPMSVSELDVWCREHGCAIDILGGDISEVDGRALRALTDRLDRLIDDFPIGRDYHALEASKLYEKFGHEVSPYFRIGYEPNESYYAEASLGFRFGCDAPHFEDVVRGNFNQIGDGTAVNGAGDINRIFDHEYGHNILNALEETSERGIFLRDDYARRLYGLEGMSEYATTNSHELFAEAFASWYGGDTTPFAMEMENILRENGLI